MPAICRLPKHNRAGRLHGMIRDGIGMDTAQVGHRVDANSYMFNVSRSCLIKAVELTSVVVD